MTDLGIAGQSPTIGRLYKDTLGKIPMRLSITPLRLAKI